MEKYPLQLLPDDIQKQIILKIEFTIPELRSFHTVSQLFNQLVKKYATELCDLALIRNNSIRYTNVDSKIQVYGKLQCSHCHYNLIDNEIVWDNRLTFKRKDEYLKKAAIHLPANSYFKYDTWRFDAFRLFDTFQFLKGKGYMFYNHEGKFIQAFKHGDFEVKSMFFVKCSENGAEITRMKVANYTRVYMHGQARSKRFNKAKD